MASPNFLVSTDFSFEVKLESLNKGIPLPISSGIIVIIYSSIKSYLMNWLTKSAPPTSQIFPFGLVVSMNFLTSPDTYIKFSLLFLGVLEKT